MKPIIRVLLADDHAVVRAALKSLLEVEADIRVIAEVSNGTDAVASAEQLKPDVVIMDLAMPGLDGIQATKQIVERTPLTRVLMLTVHSKDEALIPAIRAGAVAYVTKGEADREVVDAVRAIAQGELRLHKNTDRIPIGSPGAADRVAVARERYERLTSRERAILRFVAEGRSDLEIGDQLAISASSVGTYRRRIKEKANLTTRSEYLELVGILGRLDDELGLSDGEGRSKP